MQIHIGNLIRNEVRRQGCTNEWLADRIGVSIRTLQRIYNKPSIDTNLLLRLSIALRTNLFHPYTRQLARMTNTVT